LTSCVLRLHHSCKQPLIYRLNTLFSETRVAGASTGSVTMNWMIYYLCKNPNSKLASSINWTHYFRTNEAPKIHSRTRK
jgi:hypothetical protein